VKESTFRIPRKLLTGTFADLDPKHFVSLITDLFHARELERGGNPKFRPTSRKGHHATGMRRKAISQGRSHFKVGGKRRHV
jgi:hypothetical protein